MTVVKRQQVFHFQWLISQHNIHRCFCAITLQFGFDRYLVPGAGIEPARPEGERF